MPTTIHRSGGGEAAPVLLAFPRDEVSRRIQERIEKGEPLRQAARSVHSLGDMDAAERDFKAWSDYNEELLRRSFTGPKFAWEYTGPVSGGGVSIGERSLGQELRLYMEKIEEKLHRLASIRDRLELIPEAPGVAPASPEGQSASAKVESNKVFVVHGHDHAALETVARFLEQLQLDPVILHEQASGGRTVIEKLEHYGDVGFAVVLLTPDDVGGPENQPGQLQARARQNVILELGYFVGQLGRSHVCALHKGPLELPSDFVGVVYVPLDDARGWRLTLARELKDAGFGIDMNDVI